MSADESRCWSVAPDGITECERDHAHGGTHQQGGVYWESTRSVSPPTPEPDDPPVLDSVDRRVQSIFYAAFIEAHGITRLPGSVYVDENGEVA